MAGRVFVALDSALVQFDGERHVVNKGVTRVREGHPLLRLYPDLFGPVEDHVHFDVETAEQAPGAKRVGVRKSEPDRP